MDLLSPGFLILLGALPALVAVRIWLLRRRRTGLRYSSLSLVRDALPGSSRIRRHLPFALFVLALASLVVAMARPVNIVSVPAGQTTVILAMDVSRSMCATDIPPNRLLAAEAAAASFIERQGATTQIGVVAFAGFAEIVQAPTTDQEVLLDVI
ncbi:MAG TPA: BatA domain-containing protein, partial [Candidatus Limnocylindrales bacterium]|nr:BatA domain-containing protein [Candidatus Limnocylindrales bacterium]